MATLYEHYNTDPDAGGGDDLRYTRPKGQTFTSATAFNITSVKLLLDRSVANDPGTVTISIYNTVDGLPAGAALISGTTDGSTLTTDTAGEWREITFDNDRVLAADVMYAIVVSVASGTPDSALLWKLDAVASTYANGTRVYSGDTGGNWTLHDGSDFMFECWGDTPAFGPPSERATIKTLVVFANDKVWYEDE